MNLGVTDDIVPLFLGIFQHNVFNLGLVVMEYPDTQLIAQDHAV